MMMKTMTTHIKTKESSVYLFFALKLYGLLRFFFVSLADESVIEANYCFAKQYWLKIIICLIFKMSSELEGVPPEVEEILRGLFGVACDGRDHLNLYTLGAYMHKG